MRIYRVEHHEKNVGPYTFYEGWWSWSNRDHGEHPDTPGPTKDGIDIFELPPNDPYDCGFESLEALHRWFRADELRQLVPSGFVLSVYEVPETSVRKGQKQLVFRRSAAELVERRELIEQFHLREAA